MSIIKRKAGSEDIVKSVLEFDAEPTEGSPNLLESGAVAGAIVAATALVEESMMANLPIADSTLRFSFGDLDYDPTEHWEGRNGTWTKKNTKFTNVWDWTNESTSWATAFGGGGVGIPGAFADYENNPVKVIAAGDTSSVTDFSRLFQNCYAITEVCPIDTSNATTVLLMFSYLHNCEKFPDMDFSAAVDSNGLAGVYQACYKMKTAPNIVFPSSTQYSLANFFLACVGLDNVPLYDTSMCDNMSGMFDMNLSGVTQIPCLKSVPLFDTSRVTNMTRMFRGCSNLDAVPKFETSNVTNMSSMFYGILNTTSNIPMHIKSVPDFDYSKVTNFVLFLANNVDLTEIPEMNIEANVTSCGNMFRNCPNIKSGQKALYDKLSAIATITNHADCFKDCGSDTEEGRAELAQIPVSWGGTMEEP